ncbi:hypothetical protein R3P38DRAFT_2792125 [Favolaschia claudopus]|uniref:Uncharacterized protein n=1 Tax=Favolaschia claudopus TaxID=2862362 RepID=A0AAW0AGP7_9AGAR
MVPGTYSSLHLQENWIRRNRDGADTPIPPPRRYLRQHFGPESQNNLLTNLESHPIWPQSNQIGGSSAARVDDTATCFITTTTTQISSVRSPFSSLPVSLAELPTNPPPPFNLFHRLSSTSLPYHYPPLRQLQLDSSSHRAQLYSRLLTSSLISQHLYIRFVAATNSQLSLRCATRYNTPTRFRLLSTATPTRSSRASTSAGHRSLVGQPHPFDGTLGLPTTAEPSCAAAVGPCSGGILRLSTSICREKQERLLLQLRFGRRQASPGFLNSNQRKIVFDVGTTVVERRAAARRSRGYGSTSLERGIGLLKTACLGLPIDILGTPRTPRSGAESRRYISMSRERDVYLGLSRRQANPALDDSSIEFRGDWSSISSLPLRPPPPQAAQRLEYIDRRPARGTNACCRQANPALQALTAASLPSLTSTLSPFTSAAQRRVVFQHPCRTAARVLTLYIDVPRAGRMFAALIFHYIFRRPASGTQDVDYTTNRRPPTDDYYTDRLFASGPSDRHRIHDVSPSGERRLFRTSITRHIVVRRANFVDIILGISDIEYTTYRRPASDALVSIEQRFQITQPQTLQLKASSIYRRSKLPSGKRLHASPKIDFSPTLDNQTPNKLFLKMARARAERYK